MHVADHHDAQHHVGSPRHDDQQTPGAAGYVHGVEPAEGVGKNQGPSEQDTGAVAPGLLVPSNSKDIHGTVDRRSSSPPRLSSKTTANTA
jgi:hypothetical protein